MGSSTKKYLNAIIKYLNDESKDKENHDIDINEWSLLNCNKLTTPQQNNGFDCGVFTIMFADFIINNIPIMYINHSDMPYYRKKICLDIFVENLTYEI